jgi:carbon monoxide dehydrogenase subunit G
MIKSVIHLEAPRPQVFSVFTEFEKYRQWLPGCEKSDIVAVKENVSDVDIIVNSMKKMSLRLRFESQPVQSLSFSMLQGTDIKAYNGSYRLLDSADGRGTVVMAELEIDAGALAPRFLVDRIAKKAIDDTGNAVRGYLKSLPAAAAVAPAPAGKVKPAGRRARRILEVYKTPQGTRVWYLGQIYNA